MTWARGARVGPLSHDLGAHAEGGHVEKIKEAVAGGALEPGRVDRAEDRVEHDVAPVVPGGPGQSAEIVGTRPGLGHGQARLGADEFVLLEKAVGDGVNRSITADGNDLLGPLPQGLAGGSMTSCRLAR